MFFSSKKKNKGGSLFSPACGKIKHLSQVDDPVFSRATMGDGFAVEPDGGEICAPVSGKVSALFPGGHAIGITSSDGAEILVHIGIDTVKLKGKGFSPCVEVGSTVKQGAKLVDADLRTIQKSGFICDVICVVTSGEKCTLCSGVDASPVTHNTRVMTYAK